MKSSSTARIRVGERNEIATLRLSYPQKHNAFDDDMISEFLQKIQALRVNPPRVMVLVGDGDRCFCAGYDISCIDPDQPDDQPLPDSRFEPVVQAVQNFPVPIIAAMNGDAYGGGLDLALACDLRIARSRIKIAMTPCRLGLVYGPSGLTRFIRTVGLSTTRRLFLTAEPFEDQAALSAGLIDEIVAEPHLMERAYEVAAAIARNAPLAIQGTRLALRLCAAGAPLSATAETTIEKYRLEAFRSDELRRRLKAFRDRPRTLS